MFTGWNETEIARLQMPDAQSDFFTLHNATPSEQKVVTEWEIFMFNYFSSFGVCSVIVFSKRV
jgi:hypothetical protein